MAKKLPEFIDFHTHTFPDKIAEKTIAKLAVYSGIEPCTNGTVADTLEKFPEFGIDMCVSLNIATSLTAHTTLNNVCAENNKTYNGKMLFFGSVNPKSEEALAELERIKSLGIKGIKLHPDYQDFHPDDEIMDEFYKKCSELDLPIVFHSGWDCYSPDNIHAYPYMTVNMAKKYPKLKIVLAHLGGLRLWDDVYDVVAGTPNIWMDTAMIATMELPKEKCLAILNKHDSNQILLGSDCPWENPKRSIEYVDSLKISDDRKEKIFSKNAISFLKLQEENV